MHGFDVEKIIDRLDNEMVDDYYLVNGADRMENGRFGVWYKRRYYTDGRTELERDEQLRLAKII